MLRGEIWWASLPPPVGSGPGHRRPVVIIQADVFTRSRIGTVIVVVITSNTRLAHAPGNVLLPSKNTKLKRDCVINVSQLITIDKALLTQRIGRLPVVQLDALDDGLRKVLAF
jgi:mRNA interferase MazF